MVAFEQCHKNCKPDATAYLFFFNGLVNSANDVEILHYKGIVHHSLGSNKEAAKLVNKLCKEVDWDGEESYLHKVVCDDIDVYFKSMRAKLRARLVHYYFNNWVVGQVDGQPRAVSRLDRRRGNGETLRDFAESERGRPRRKARVVAAQAAAAAAVARMARSTGDDAQALLHSLRSAYAATPKNLKIIDLYVAFAVFTALIQVVYMALVGSFPFNSFLSGVLSCIGTAVLAVCLRIQVNKENKEFKDLPPERAFADFVLCNLVLHLVIMNFLVWMDTVNLLSLSLLSNVSFASPASDAVVEDRPRYLSELVRFVTPVPLETSPGGCFGLICTRERSFLNAWTFAVKGVPRSSPLENPATL
ncbi:hypothetical protein NL676_007764 [Syzygium grande]|nr:hypothetical protein NL676_007764 [Syzygium grande]